MDFCASVGRSRRLRNDVYGGDAVVMPRAEQVQVWFALTGFNASSFGMGAEVISPEQVRLPSAPWFPVEAAKGDILRVQRGQEGKPLLVKMV